MRLSLSFVLLGQEPKIYTFLKKTAQVDSNLMAKHERQTLGIISMKLTTINNMNI